jgi:hypothetical protein
METANLIITLCAFLLGAVVYSAGLKAGNTVRESAKRSANKPKKEKPVTPGKSFTSEEDEEEGDKPSLDEQWTNVFEYEGPPRKGTQS